MKLKNKNPKEYKRIRRHRRVRNRVAGTSERPRLCVFRSARHIYAQIIDDSQGKTLASASSIGAKAAAGGKDKASARVASARDVGKRLAEAAKEKGIEKVCFDRGGFLYHGRVAALAEAARKAGLSF